MSSDLAPQGTPQGTPAGTRSIEAVLAELPSDGWRVLHDIAVPGQRRTTIDHVVIGPPGVYVINLMEPDARGGDKRLEQVSEAARALRGLTSITSGDDVRPVLCLLTESPVDGWSHGVVVGSLSTIVELLSGRRGVLDRDQVNHTALELDATTDRKGQPRKQRGGHRLDAPRRGWRRGARS
jgi:Nuclease-related domain